MLKSGEKEAFERTNSLSLCDAEPLPELDEESESLLDPDPEEEDEELDEFEEEPEL